MYNISRQYLLILSAGADSVRLTFQVQYYRGTEYVGSRHWCVALVPRWPLVVGVRGGD